MTKHLYLMVTHALIYCSVINVCELIAQEAEEPPTLSDATLIELIKRLSTKDYEIKKSTIRMIALSGNANAIQALTDYEQGRYYLDKDENLYWIGETYENKAYEEIGILSSPLTHEAVMHGSNRLEFKLDELQAIIPSGRERILIRNARNLQELSDPDPLKRQSAAIRLSDRNNLDALDSIRERLQDEKNKRVKDTFEESTLLLELTQQEANPMQSIKVIERLGEMRSGRAISRLKVLQETAENQNVRHALRTAIEQIESYQNRARLVGYIFSGISLGSILVLMALGLSIIFGLMGVINMAHGELMMIGAYAAYMTQQAFVLWLPPSYFDYYFILAMPSAFIASALVGYGLETILIRHLYGRPLETLLATWATGIIIIQFIRLVFGDNIGVNSPTWLQGGAEVMRDVIFPYNRIFIVFLCLLSVVLIGILMHRTKLGLLVRATTQNRSMAEALGVSTRRIDGYTFALGSGLAGLAGCALTLIGGVTPEMGKNYIVDSFLVVVTGGVGKLAGAVWAGMGLGCITKVLEPYTQAVFAKVIILIMVVLFIQWKPSGLFPAKGRNADA